jgi:predicted metalloendopeptidase
MRDKNKTRRRIQTAISIPPVKASHEPGNDFYKYVNEAWLDSARIPTYKSSFGVSEEVELEMEAKLQTILDKAYAFAETGVGATTKTQKMLDIVGRFLLSILREGKQKHSVDYLIEGTRSLYCIRDTKDICRYLGLFNHYGIPSLLSVETFEKKMPQPAYHILIRPGTLGLPDLSYYNATAPGRSKAFMAYVKLNRAVSAELHTSDLTRAVQLEAILSRNLQDANGDAYTDYTAKELETAFPLMEWDIFFEEWGVSEIWREKTIRVCSPRWIQFLQKGMQRWSLSAWSTLFTWHMVLHALPTLPAPFSTLHFELFGKMLRGQLEKLPTKHLALNLSRILLRIPLSHLFVKMYLPATFKKEATSFAETIRTHAVHRIDTIDWLEPATRKIAKQKIQDMIFSISHPESSDTVELPELITDNLLKNIYLLNEMNVKASQHRLSHFTDARLLWDDAPYTVNAYYYGDMNQFILPAGSIQWPFYAKDRLGWSYGGLGAVIGHEITHAFDIQGKQVLPNGEKKAWWTRADNLRYNKKTRELISLFSHAKIYNHPVDGYATLSENLADLGGLGIALDALEHELSGRSDTEKEKEFRDFFLSYAVSWRIKQRPRKALQSLFLDVHSPAEYRVNYIVSHFDRWYELFGVKTENDLYIPPEGRVRIF